MLAAVSSVQQRWGIVTGAVRGNLRSRRWWAERPVNTFTTDGVEVVEGFLDRAECERLVRLADEHLPGPSHVVAGDCYTWVKSEAAHGRNSAVRELLNVQAIDTAVADLVERRVVQDLFAERLGEPVELLGVSIQHDDVDTRSKRGWHVDAHFPPELKAFVYLNDVDEDGDGPYTIIPGSHRHRVRKVANDVVNALTSGARRDMRRFVPDRRARRIHGPAGTLILSTQDAIHKGWGDHWRRPRHALIFYGRPASFFTGGPLTEGRDRIAVG